MLQIMYPLVINRKEQFCSISFICSLLVIQSMLWDLPVILHTSWGPVLHVILVWIPETGNWKSHEEPGEPEHSEIIPAHHRNIADLQHVCVSTIFFPFSQTQNGNIAFLHVQVHKIDQLILRDSGVTALPSSFSLYLREGSFSLDGSYEKGENMSWQY